jgi:type I restriction enzyme R subunit
VRIEWPQREDVRAQLRVLRKPGYQPGKQDKALQIVLEEAELLSE